MQVPSKCGHPEPSAAEPAVDQSPPSKCRGTKFTPLIANTHVCHPERKRGISQMFVEHTNQVGSNSCICEIPSSSMRLGMTRDESEIFNPAVWKPPSLGSIVRRDGCDAAEIATDGMRCSRRSVDPDPLRDRRLHLSDRAGGSGISALGTGSERSHS